MFCEKPCSETASASHGIAARPGWGFFVHASRWKPLGNLATVAQDRTGRDRRVLRVFRPSGQAALREERQSFGALTSGYGSNAFEARGRIVPPSPSGGPMPLRRLPDVDLSASHCSNPSPTPRRHPSALTSPAPCRMRRRISALPAEIAPSSGPIRSKRNRFPKNHQISRNLGRLSLIHHALRASSGEGAAGISRWDIAQSRLEKYALINNLSASDRCPASTTVTFVCSIP